MPTVSGPVRRLDPLRGASVAGCGWRKSKSALAFFVPYVVFQGVCVRREEPDPAPDAGVVFGHLGDALKRFVVRVNTESSGPKVVAQSFIFSNDASGLKVEGRPQTCQV